MSFSVQIRRADGKPFRNANDESVDTKVICVSPTTPLPIPNVGELVSLQGHYANWKVERREFDYGYESIDTNPENDRPSVAAILYVSQVDERSVYETRGIRSV